MPKSSRRKRAKSRNVTVSSNVPALRNSANSQANPNTTLTRTQTFTQVTAGPTPDADTLARYGEIIPDAPERILRMAEKQSDHRQYLEKRVIDADVRRAYFGVACAFIITMTVMISGFYLVLNNR